MIGVAFVQTLENTFDLKEKVLVRAAPAGRPTIVLLHVARFHIVLRNL